MVSLMRFTTSCHFTTRLCGDPRLLRNYSSLKLVERLISRSGCAGEIVRCTNASSKSQGSSRKFSTRLYSGGITSFCRNYNGTTRMFTMAPCGHSRHMATKSELAKKRKAWKFETDIDKARQSIVTKDTVIYARPEGTIWRLGGVGAGAMLFMGITIAYNTYMAIVDSRHEKNQARHSLALDQRGLVSLCLWITVGIMIPFSMVCAWMALSYPTHVVQKLTLLKGAKGVVMYTHANLKPPQAMTVAMSQISRGIPYKQGSPWATIEVDGKRLAYLMDLRKGQFYEPELFNNSSIFPQFPPKREVSVIQAAWGELKNNVPFVVTLGSGVGNFWKKLSTGVRDIWKKLWKRSKR